MSAHRFNSLSARLILAVLAAGVIFICQPAEARVGKLKGKPGPDLAIKRVWIGPDCRIRVRLVNTGKRPIKIKSSRQPALSIQLDKGKPRLFTFAQVDPAAKLSMPGGWLVFIAPATSRMPKRVRVVVDPKNLIREATEKNNHAEATGSGGGCRAASSRLPLMVHSVYRQKGTLHVRLVGAKKFRPSRRDMLAIKLKVGVKGQRRSWTLTKVDPLGKLRRSHRVEFDTRIKVKPGAEVKTLLKWAGGEKAKDFTVPARIVVRRGEPVARPQVRALATPAILALAAQGATGPTGNVTLKSLDSGIHISTPRQGQQVTRGANLSIRYRMLHETPAGTVRFHLFRDQEEVASTTGHYRPRRATGRFLPYNVFNWRLPADLEPGDDYHVLVTKDPHWSLSDAFKIEAITDAGPGHSTAWEIRLVTPGRIAVSWPRGSTKTIAWVIDGNYPDERQFNVRLMRGGGRVLAIEGTPRWNAASKSYALDWAIPADLTPASDYRIMVADRGGPTEGWSQSNFAITGPIEVLYPPATRYIANPTQIRWRLAPGSGVRNVRIVLVDSAGAEAQVITSSTRAENESFNWVMGANFKDNDGTWKFWRTRGSLPQGHGYAVRVMDTRDHSNYGQSQNFSIAVPTVNVSTSESNCNRGVRVHWDSPDLHESVRMTITVRYLCAGICAHDSEDPGPADNHAFIYIADNAHSSGNFCWKFGEHVRHSYASCASLPDPFARVAIWPKGFKWVAFWSNTFRLDDRDCH